MRLIHLSDFHLTKEHEGDFEEYIIKPLLEDLIALNTQKTIDLIIFTGDLIDKGGKGYESIDDAFLEFEIQVIERITAAINISKNRFIIIPGNHDINRDADLKSTEIGLRSQLISLEAINTFLNDPREFEGATKRILKFKEFERNLYANSPETIVTDLESIHRYEVQDLKVGIACLNSAWRCYDSDSDQNNILIGEKQIMAAINKTSDSDIRIALLHHPLEDISPIEKKIMRDRIVSNFDLVLTGHVHQEDNFRFSNMQGSTIFSASAASWSGNIRSFNTEFINGYSIIDYDYNIGCKLIYKKYSHKKKKFIRNNEFGDDNGEEYYTFPKNCELAEKKRIKQIIEEISEVHCESLDEHLLTFNTDTSAPKTINDLFVLPKLVRKNEDVIEDSLTEVVEEKYTIQDLCKLEENIILLGVKESGKTILLDKILMEYTNDYEFYEKIPVYLNFEDINGTEMDTIISKYLKVGIKDIRNGDFNLNNLVLLIDNIKFEERYRKILNKLNVFLEKYPDLKVILTCTANGEDEIPLDAINDPFFKMFSVINVKQFNTKEIKELIVKWFSGRNEILNKTDNLDNIIRAFTALNLPRTPLAVSMFLWIIEKQENYAPVNNAQMLENFLERLFTKADTHTVYSSNFTYKNKESMLADIAYKMYSENKPQYRLAYGEIRNFIENSLKEKKFDFDADVILDHFINKGIFNVELVESIKFVKFKFGCFFQFYLMKNFDKNSDFKKYVMADYNYLNFVDELDYYTGLKMDDIETVELIVNNMQDAYNELNQKLEQLPKKIDTIFETVQTIVGNLNKEKIDTITSELKETEEDYYESKDLELENHSSKKIENKLKDMSAVQKLERHWLLSAKVLKNSEEITKGGFKVEAFKAIVKSSLSYAALYKLVLIKKKEEKHTELDEQFYLLYKLLPFVHQVLLTQNIGTAKLNLVIEEIIEDEMFDTYSDFEKFIYVFIYADLNGRHKFKYIKKIIDNWDTHYIKDMVFLKNLEYFYSKDTSNVDELKYKNILGDIVEEKSMQEHSGRSLHKKGRFINRIEKEKLERSLINNENFVESN